MAEIKASQKYRSFVKGHEGFGASVYEDVTGKKTQGYGSTTKLHDGAMTKEQASEQLERDIAEKERIAATLITREDLTPGQQDVVIDLLFNVRMPSLTKAKMFERINNREDQSVFESLGKYTKAKSKDTGLMTVYPGLVKRSKDRQDLWGNPSLTSPIEGAPPQATSPYAPADDVSRVESTADSDLGKIQLESAPRSEQDLLDTMPDISQVRDQPKTDIDGETLGQPLRTEQDLLSTMPEVQESEPATNRERQDLESLRDSRAAFDDTDPDHLRKARDLSDKDGTPLEDAMAVVQDDRFEDYEVDTSLEELTIKYPALTRWGARPGNYAILKRGMDGLKKVEEESSSFKELEIVGQEIAFDLEEVKTIFGVATGLVNPLDGDISLKDIRQRRKNSPASLLQKEQQLINKSFEEVTEQFGDVAAAWKAASAIPVEDAERLYPAVINLAKETGLSISEMVSAFDTMRKNPGAAGVMSLRSMGSSAGASIVGQVAGAGTFGALGFLIGNAPGAVIGATTGKVIGGGVAGGVYAYATRMQELIRSEGFEDNLAGFFSDPARAEKAQKISAKYAVYMGGIDAMLSFLGGRFVGKSATKAKGLKGVAKGKEVAKGLAKDVAVQTAGEPAQEFGARVLPGPGVAGDDPVEAAGEAFQELALAGPGTVGRVAVGFGIEKATGMFKGEVSPKEQADAFVKESKKAINTIQKRSAYERLRTAWKESKSAAQNPKQVGDLVKESAAKESDDAVSIADDREVEGADNKEIKANEEQLIIDNEERQAREIESSEVDPVVRIKHSDWEKYHQSQGNNPTDIIAELGPEFVEEYAKSRREGREMEVPLHKFLQAFGDDDGVSAIVRFGDDELNAVEASKNLDSLEESLEEGLFEEGDDEGPDFTFLTGEPKEGDPVLRPIDLISRFRNTEERKVMDKITAGINKMSKNIKVIPDDVAEYVTELQFRHVRYRANLTGRSINEIADELKFQSRDKIKGARGHISFQATNGGQIKFQTPMQLVMRLSETQAGPATILHEFAHTWLIDMAFDTDFIDAIEEGSLTTRQAEYKRTMQDTAEMLGYKNMKELQQDTIAGDTSKLRRAHETFAQTAEKYFLEGKFKNSKIRAIMEKLKQFLLPFASMIGKSYPHFPPLTISPEVERVFETILDTSNIVQDEVYDMFPPPAFDQEQLGAQWPKYMEAYNDARDEAVAKAYARSFSQNVREREKIITKALDDIFDRASAEVDSYQSMRILKAFKEGPAGAKISERSFIDLFGTAARASIAKGIVAGQKKAGRDIHEVMAEIGIQDPKEFLKLLQEAANRDKLVDEVSTRMIGEEFPATKSDDEIHEIAVEEVNSGGKEKLMRAEMKIFKDKYFSSLKKVGKALILPPDMQRRLVKEATKLEAAQIVSSTTVNKFKVERFLKQSNRHGKDASNLFVKNDIIGALEAKQREIVYFEAYKNAKIEMKRVARTTVLLKRIAKSKDATIARTYDIDGYNLARQTVHAFSTGSQIPMVDISNLPANSPTVYGKEWMASINAKVMAVEAALSKGDRTNPSVETFIAMGELVNVQRSSAYHAKNIEIAGKSFVREAISARLRDEIGPRKKGDPKKDVSPNTFARKHLKSLEKFRETMTSLFPNNEEFAKSQMAAMYNWISEAEANFIRDKEAAGAEMEKLFRDRLKAHKSGTWRDIVDPILKRIPLARKLVPISPVFSQELDHKFNSIEEILVMILHMGSESGIEKMLMGGTVEGGALATWNFETGRVDDSKAWAFINRLIEEKVLVKEDFDTLQGIWDIFDKHYDGANESHQHIRGYRFGKIEGKAIETPFGTYRGGYFPANRDSAYADLTPGMDSMISDATPRGFDDLFPSSNLGFANERTRSHYPLSLSLSVLPGALHSVLQLKHLSSPLYEFGKVFGDKELISTLENRRPGAMKDVVVPWFKRTMAQQYSSASPEDRTALAGMNHASRIIRQNARVHWFFGNFTSGLKQLLGVIQAGSKVKMRHLTRGFYKSLLNPIDTQRKIRERSNRMDVRFKANQKRLMNSYEDLDLNGDWVTLTKERRDQATFFIIQMMQNITDTAVWDGAYEQAFESGLTDAQAIGFADNTVEQTQASSTISSRAAFQQVPEVIRLFTDFTTVPLAQFHQNLETYRQNMDEDTFIRFKRQFEVAFFTVLLPSLIIGASGALVTSAMKGKGREDEEDDLALQIAADSLDAGIPLFGRYAGALIKGREPTISPALSAVSSLMKAGSGLSDTANGINMLPGDFAAIFDAATILTGIPMSPIARGMRMLEKATPQKQKRKEAKIRGRQLKIQRRKENILRLD